MLSRKNSFSFRVALAVTTIALVGVVAAAVTVTQAVRSRNAANSIATPAQVVTALPSPGFVPAVAIQQPEQIESELITVSRFGFMPLAIKRPAKDFVLTIVNRSADPELNLTLSRTVGNRPTDKVIDVKLKRGRGSWNAHFNLPPGDYELTEINNPNWKCTITVTPR
ncbi:MAG: hypothetical protein AAB401_12715 [Acidobacteriota bacterium]